LDVPAGLVTSGEKMRKSKRVEKGGREGGRHHWLKEVGEEGKGEMAAS